VQSVFCPFPPGFMTEEAAPAHVDKSQVLLSDIFNALDQKKRGFISRVAGAVLHATQCVQHRKGCTIAPSNRCMCQKSCAMVQTPKHCLMSNERPG